MDNNILLRLEIAGINKETTNIINDGITKITSHETKYIPNKSSSRSVGTISDVIIAAVITGGMAMIIEIIKLIFQKKENPHITVTINNNTTYSINDVKSISLVDKEVKVENCKIEVK